MDGLYLQSSSVYQRMPRSKKLMLLVLPFLQLFHSGRNYRECMSVVSVFYMANVKSCGMMVSEAEPLAAAGGG